MELKHNSDVGGRCQQHLDESIHNVLRCLKDKFLNRLVSLTRGKVSMKVSELHKRHKASETLVGMNLTQQDIGRWLVPSERNDVTGMIELYEVDIVNLQCQCSIRCNECNACIHAFTSVP